MIKTFFIFLVSFLFILSSLPAASPKKLKKIQPTYARTAYVPDHSEVVKMELLLIGLINDVRAQHRLKPLIQSNLLTSAAQIHSANMAKGAVSFGHDGFDKRATEIRKHGIHNSFGENVAYSHHIEKPLEAAVQGWMKSPGHRENILGDYNETGIGIAFDAQGKCYITQLFAKKNKSKVNAINFFLCSPPYFRYCRIL